jgi:hypothetical protein
MPLLVLLFALGVVLGLTASRRNAVSITAAVALLVLGGFVWAVIDGKGDDAPWLIAVAAAGGVIAVALSDRLAVRSCKGGGDPAEPDPAGHRGSRGRRADG